MIDAVIRWSLKNRLVVAARRCLGGGPRGDFPPPPLTVITEAHGMAPEEVESRRLPFRSRPR